MIKKGYILFFTMIMLAMGTALITQIFYMGNLYNSYVSITLDRERARQLALGGVSVAMSQLMLLDKENSSPKEEEKGEQKEKTSSDKTREENQKKLQELLLQIQHRWQTFILKYETDGLDAELKICISCENGKIDCNKFYNYDIHKFISLRGQDTEKFYKVLGEKLTPLLKGKNIADSVTSFISTQKRPLLTATEFLKDKKLAEVFDNHIFYVPPVQPPAQKHDDETTKSPQEVFLTDLFTVHGESSISMWSISPSLQKAFGLYSDRKMTPERAKEILKQVNVDEINSPEKLSTALQTIYGGKNSALPLEFLNSLDPKFEPRLFSVLCYAKVGRVGQKLLALLEKVPMKDGETIKMIKVYWI